MICQSGPIPFPCHLTSPDGRRTNVWQQKLVGSFQYLDAASDQRLMGGHSILGAATRVTACDCPWHKSTCLFGSLIPTSGLQVVFTSIIQTKYGLKTNTPPGFASTIYASQPAPHAISTLVLLLLLH